VHADKAAAIDWRDSAAYAPLLAADRSLFAWEWLRRDARYAQAATEALSWPRLRQPSAADFGLITFEAPGLAVPAARPVWSSTVHPYVLPVTPDGRRSAGDSFDPGRFVELATLVEGEEGDHLLLCDGLRAIRIDAPAGTLSAGPVGLRYLLEGLESAERLLLALQRLLALYRGGRFSRSLHSPETRARRWILMLRAWDALASGAGQRDIALELLSRTAGEARWRSREPSVRSQAQRLVRSARHFAAGGYRALLS
jgi:hypothetical protein